MQRHLAWGPLLTPLTSVTWRVWTSVTGCLPHGSMSGPRPGPGGSFCPQGGFDAPAPHAVAGWLRFPAGKQLFAFVWFSLTLHLYRSHCVQYPCCSNASINLCSRTPLLPLSLLLLSPASYPSPRSALLQLGRWQQTLCSRALYSTLLRVMSLHLSCLYLVSPPSHL
jgi:hypothetical protein